MGIPSTRRIDTPKRLSIRRRDTLFVVRAITIIEITSIAVARSAGWAINRPLDLGLRAVALHPRLYSVARIRGLGFDTLVRAKYR